MPRFVVAKRTVASTGEEADLRSRTAFPSKVDAAAPMGMPVVSGPVARLGLRAEVIEADASFLISPPPGSIVEEEILHWPDIIPPPDLPLDRAATPLALGTGLTEPFALHVMGGGRPLPHVSIKLYARWSDGLAEYSGVTDAGGRCTLSLALGHEPFTALIDPAGGFWPMVVRGHAIAAGIECPALPNDGPLGWWHGVLGLDVHDPDLGKGIRVGVIDTGAGPHPCLSHLMSIGAFLGGNAYPPGSGSDVAAHGTHVCGTIGARSVVTGTYAGIAPGCDLLVARAFSGPASGASNADIANAIDALSRDHGVDLINLSLGADTPSLIVQSAIQDAADRGTLCICAAGNNGGAVQYPAAFPEAVGVAALGLAGWGPPGSLSASRLPLDAALFGRENLFSASFSSHGPGVDCSAPGVGILATVPDRHGTTPLFGAMDGTSMASPVVCAALAALLSRDASYKALPRNSERTDAARQMLMGALRSIGLPSEHEGRGMPRLGVETS